MAFQVFSVALDHNVRHQQDLKTKTAAAVK